MSQYVVPVKAGLSNDEFLHEHVLARQPVVIKDALTTWNALRWTPQYLTERAGARRVCYRTEGEPRVGTFGELVDCIFNGPNDAPAPYLRNVNVGEQLPELVDDITPEPVYSRDNWRSSALMPSAWPAAVKKGAYELFVSRTAAAFPYLHIDYWGMSAFLAQICGEKDVILFPPEDAPHLYPSASDPLVSAIADVDDLARYPRIAAARQHRVTLGPGDLLYNPAWWHTTRTRRTSITIIWAYWNRHEWTHLLAETRRIGARGRMLATYLRLVGMCNRYA